MTNAGKFTAAEPKDSNEDNSLHLADLDRDNSCALLQFEQDLFGVFLI